MIRAIILDSTPLGLIVNRPGFKPADECRAWLTRHLAAGIRVHVPAIIAYELRRELLRLGSTASLSNLEQFNRAEQDRYLTLTDADLTHAAELWSRAQQQGRPTADKFALDIDVILSAQALALKLPVDQFVIATENVGHLGLFVPCKPWRLV